MPRHAMPRRTSHATPSCHHAIMPCHAAPHATRAMPCHVMPRHAAPCHSSWCVVLAGPRLTAHDCLPCRYSEDGLRTRGEEALRPADRAAVQVRKLQSPLNAQFVNCPLSVSCCATACHVHVHIGHTFIPAGRSAGSDCHLSKAPCRPTQACAFGLAHSWCWTPAAI